MQILKRIKMKLDFSCIICCIFIFKVKLLLTFCVGIVLDYEDTERTREYLYKIEIFRQSVIACSKRDHVEFFEQIKRGSKIKDSLLRLSW